MQQMCAAASESRIARRCRCRRGIEDAGREGDFLSRKRGRAEGGKDGVGLARPRRGALLVEGSDAFAGFGGVARGQVVGVRGVEVAVEGGGPELAEKFFGSREGVGRA